MRATSVIKTFNVPEQIPLIEKFLLTFRLEVKGKS